MNDKIKVFIVTPVHNEGDSIRQPLNEFFEFYQNSNFEVSLLCQKTDLLTIVWKKLNLSVKIILF